MSALNGWHRGERVVRRKLGYDRIPSTNYMYTMIDGEMPEQHSTFYSTRLHFLPVCVLDEQHRPWSSILAGKGGRPGFIDHPKYNTLSINAKLWDGEPFLKHLKARELDQNNGFSLIAGIGVEISTRRRNKFAGAITKTKVKGNEVNIELFVNEALGNCPKYITLRDLAPYPTASCIVLEDRHHLSVGERLSDASIAFILEADTVFFGTTYQATDAESSEYPSHLGMNHRGGRAGFMRVKPSDGRTIILPDFSGNRIMTSLGNVEATPLASLTFINFTTGDILYLTGEARNVYGPEARAIMPFQDTFTEVYVTGYTFVRDAFPARVKPGYKIQPSPYNPPVRLLAEEATQTTVFAQEDQPKALLTRISLHNPTIATFEWESSSPLRINPGQAIILGFSPLLGSRSYQHMAPGRPSSINDDFIRTWTVSSATPVGTDNRHFALTMRLKPGGVVTGALFNLTRKLAEHRRDMLDDSRALSLKVDIVGISGEFILPELVAVSSPAKEIKHLVWIAGGIGVTPFLSMLAALAKASEPPPWDITFLISTREPDVILALITHALGGKPCPSYLRIHVFTNEAVSGSHADINFATHNGRIKSSFFDESKEVFGGKDTELFLCGSEPFERSVLESLGKLGVNSGKVHREGFAY
ncbi:hypothetical protein GALMADRAFT_257293 [Galerina marginata CBS 339.88]|uniref:Oxidoreductase FAD/NAD(P)-binding domain-containing protein n=1 Tax=Galerina marginata (strain CBS 339.88) TaxID=685588 RepID=A0A067SBM7_GALM3|nr:hypothetical protein GALMADRAFT_257293 [Galerina marginata CBS 339.88]